MMQHTTLFKRSKYRAYRVRESVSLSLISLCILGLQYRLAHAKAEKCVRLEGVRRLFEDDLASLSDASTTNCTGDKRQHQQDEEYEEQDLGDTCRSAGNAAHHRRY